MRNNDIEKTMLVVSTDCLHLRRTSRYVDVESPDDHLRDVGEVQPVLEERDRHRLLDQRTMPCDQSPTTNNNGRP